MPRSTTAVPLSHPDLRAIHVLAVLQKLSLIAVAGIAAFTLTASLLASLRPALLNHWTLGTAEPAICALLGALSLTLSMPARSLRSVVLSQALAATLILISTFEALRHLTTSDPTLPADHSLPQAAFAYLFLGSLILCLRIRKPVLSLCVDALTAATCMLVLVFFFSYTLGLLGVPDVSHLTYLSGETIACLTLLTFVAFNQRAEYGLFSVLYDGGIAGKTARLAAPFALGLPILRSIGRGYIRPEYVTALTSFAAFSLLLMLCIRIRGLEREVRDLSLRDDLTGLYNRRGFNVLAEQAYRLARRSGEPFSVLFIDMDNLKQINDLCGHDAGSALLQETATILRRTFRETDVIGRIGGDEFVIAGKGSSDELENALQRLQKSVSRTNQSGARPYSISFSLGHTTTDHIVAHALEDLIQHADQIMYDTKRLKKKSASAQLNRMRSAQP